MEANSCQIENWKRNKNKTEFTRPNRMQLTFIHRVTSNRSLANLQKWEVGIAMYSPCCLLFLCLLCGRRGWHFGHWKTFDTHASAQRHKHCVSVNGEQLIRCEILVFPLLCFVPFHFQMCFKRIFMCEKCKKKIDKERNAT